MARDIDKKDIPDGWRHVLLDEVTERRSGHTPSKSNPENWNGGIKWISLSDSSSLDKGYVYRTEKEISAEGIKNSSANILPAETVVLSRDAGIGKSGVMAEPMAVSQHFIAWVCDNNKKMNSWFLYNWLQTHKREFERQAVGSTIKTIGLPYFKKLKVLAPSYQEQEKIAKMLSTWDKAIHTTERLISNSRQQKKALIQQLLTAKKRFPEYKDKWFSYTLEQLFEFKKGKGISKNERSLTGKNKCVLYGELYTKYNEVIESIYSKTDVNDSFISKAGDLLIPSSTTTSGIDLANVTAILEDNVLLGGDINILRPKQKLDPSFFSHLLTHIKKHEIASRAQGITIIHLYGKDLKDIEVLIPPSYKEQAKIASILASTDKEINLLVNQLNDLKQEKKALMQQLLTGKRRVKIEGKAA